MPELPDITIYVERLAERLVGEKLVAVRIGSPFVVRSVEPAPDAAVGCACARIGRRRSPSSKSAAIRSRLPIDRLGAHRSTARLGLRWVST